jgi:hypothetical protein
MLARRLLRPRHKRPCHRYAAEQSDELATFQLINVYQSHRPTDRSKDIERELARTQRSVFYNQLLVANAPQ